MHVYGAAMCMSNADDDHEAAKGWPTVNMILAVRLTYDGIVRWMRKMNWNKEICDHLIWIGERDDFEVVDVKIEEVVKDTLKEKGIVPELFAKVSFSVRNKHTGKIELPDVHTNVIICPADDMTI